LRFLKRFLKAYKNLKTNFTALPVPYTEHGYRVSQSEPHDGSDRSNWLSWDAILLRSLECTVWWVLWSEQRFTRFPDSEKGSELYWPLACYSSESLFPRVRSTATWVWLLSSIILTTFYPPGTRLTQPLCVCLLVRSHTVNGRWWKLFRRRDWVLSCFISDKFS